MINKLTSGLGPQDAASVAKLVGGTLVGIGALIAAITSSAVYVGLGSSLAKLLPAYGPTIMLCITAALYVFGFSIAAIVVVQVLVGYIKQNPTSPPGMKKASIELNTSPVVVNSDGVQGLSTAKALPGTTGDVIQSAPPITVPPTPPSPPAAPGP